MDKEKGENSGLRYSAMGEKELFIDLKTRSAGLNAEEAGKRLKEVGLNQLTSHQTGAWRIFGRQFKSAFVYLLFGAALITLVLDSRIDGFIILAFILINATLGFYQEYRSERALVLLKAYLVHQAKVRRGGAVCVVPASELVPGDIAVLETGDRVAADIRFLEARNLVLDESILTGESVSVTKTSEAMAHPAQNAYQARNLAFSGTTVVAGYGEGVVIATGSRTMLGRIARLTTESAKESSFAKGTDNFSRFILRLVSMTLAFLFIANVLIKGGSADWIELLTFSIALAVSVIPEALPVVTTMSLSHGALKLAKKKVVVKRLSAIEDLGGIELLCTDKTGTITENKLALAGKSPQADKDLYFYANLASEESKEKLEPFDAALYKGLDASGRARLKRYKRLETIPFDPNKRWGAAIVSGPSQELMIVRGAPEILIEHSTLKPDERRELKSWAKERGKAGERVLGIARIQMRKTGAKCVLPHGLELLGIAAFADPVKKSAFEAVEKAKELGVGLMILTGDSVEVAGAVAHEIGLVTHPDEVLSGEGLFRLPLEAQKKALAHAKVVARVSPEQKYAILKILKETREVGFLGEGINDAPALKIAGVSLVVESASEIAREAADIILLQKDLRVIVEGIREGRAVFANTIKYIKATMASNFGNFYAVAIVSLFIDYLPMLPIQILLLNLLSDFPMIAIAADRVGPHELARPQRYDLKDIIVFCTMLGLVSTVFDFLFFASFVRLGEGALQTNWFIGSILTELALIFSIRSRRLFLRAQAPARILSWLSGAAALATVTLPFTALGRGIFHFQSPRPRDIILILSLVLVYFASTEGVKHLYYRYWVKPAVKGV